MACYQSGDGSIGCTFQPRQERRVHSTRRTDYGDRSRPGYYERLDGDRYQPPTPTKTAIVIDLDELGDLMQTYVAELIGEDERVLEAVRFSTFLAWLQKRQEGTNASTA